MDRGYSSGFSGWGGSGGGGGGSSRGSGSYDLYGYKDSMSGGGFGGSGYGSNERMKRGLSGGSLLSSGATADAVIAKINQRLDMLTQLEGGMKSSARGDRFDQYESFDSRSASLGPRDLYRSGSFGYSDSRGDMMAQRGGVGFGVMGGAGGGGSGFDGFGSAKMRSNRDSAFSGSGWGAGQRSPRRGGASGGRGFNRRQDSSSSAGMGGRSGRGGGQGHSPAGRGKLPSLLSNRMYPDSGAFQSQRGPQDFRSFGGGPRANRQRGRKRPLNRQVKGQRDGQKKRKQTLSATDEPESKMGKTETAREKRASDAAAEEQKQESEEANAAAAAAADNRPEDGGESAATSNQDEGAQAKAKQTPPPASKIRKRRGFFERSGVKVSAHRVIFACSVCKFRSFYSEDMHAHLESKFHKDHFKFLSNQLSKPTTDFLQEYLNNKFKKTEQRVSQIENHSATICQVFKEQDLTRDIGMEHFMKKVEAAHCSACDVFIPMQYMLIQKHLKSPDHNYNRKGMMEQSKRASLSVARSILNHKVIGKKLESYLKGENPFNGSQDDQDPEDSMVMEVSEADLTNESLNEVKQEEEGPQAEGAEPAAEAVGNGEGHDEEMKMETGGAAEEAEEEEGVEVEEGVEGVEVGEEEAAELAVSIDAGATGDADAAPVE
ncbi:A-kinase anchor protein 8-like isoform X1 [Megalobrama amblycephala]|uniref:A-kinase anchor protein 8-like isoform X1 n=1 Tax=Megalobrama amblycephala TaxID=75352 RepID=UPI002013DCE5|nr:A-kinase anchor protein 8-like isoform X1 [Megalobrama amblycephala]